MSKSSCAAPVGLNTHESSSTGAHGGRLAPATRQVAIPTAMYPAVIPRSSYSSRVLARIVRTRRRASSRAVDSRTRSESLVGRPASIMAIPPGCAVVRSRVPEGRSRYQRRVLRPPRSTRCRCQVRTAAATRSARGSPSAGNGSGTGADRVAAAGRTWQRHLVDLGGRNTLLWYRDLPSGTLDLTTSHPSGLASLLAGRPTKLSDLVREPAALEEARRRASSSCLLYTSPSPRDGLL